MLDPKLIRANPEKVRQGILAKNENVAILDEFLEVDEKRRALLVESEKLKAERNRVSEEIARMKRAAGGGERFEIPSELVERTRAIGDKIKELDRELRELEERQEYLLLRIPNLPDGGTPIGKDASENVEIRRWGEPRKFDFEPAPHWELATSLDIIDFERGSKIAGSGFILYKGLGAKLERALFNWMADLHVAEHGYTEVFTPYLVNRRSMIGTGQIPKLEEDMYHDPDVDLFLIPTAEVPVTNMYADEIIDGSRLPIYHTAYSACFRREAGAAGKETRGLLRVHQFDKVEMVKWTAPEDSWEEHEKLLANAEAVLQKLGLPYRVILLCSGDLSFAAAKCYDLEAWAPGVGQWLEVSSCSNFTDFQARRANIRFKRGPGQKPEFVHTLNASGIALPRTLVAILENYQQKDGTVVVPEVLRPYMGGIEVIA